MPRVQNPLCHTKDSFHLHQKAIFLIIFLTSPNASSRHRNRHQESFYAHSLPCRSIFPPTLFSSLESTIIVLDHIFNRNDLCHDIVRTGCSPEHPLPTTDRQQHLQCSRRCSNSYYYYASSSIGTYFFQTFGRCRR